MRLRNGRMSIAPRGFGALGVLSWLLLLGPAGCEAGSQVQPSEHLEVMRIDAVPAKGFVAYFTWRDFQGVGDPARAVYVWQGRDVGAGKEGFAVVLAKLRGLPKGSKVLMYPSYTAPLEFLADSVRRHPWQDDRGKLMDVLRERNLTLLCSVRDHEGRLHPDFDRCGSREDWIGANPPDDVWTKLPADLAARDVRALREIEYPSKRGDPGSVNFAAFKNDKRYLPGDYYRMAPEAVDFLVATPSDVREGLLAVARSARRPGARHRALRVLALRGSRGARELLLERAGSDDAVTRYLAWDTFAYAAKAKALSLGGQALQQALGLYRKETDAQVRSEIESTLGEAKAAGAVEALIDTIRKDPNAAEAVWALGQIGDPKAVPDIIRAHARRTRYDAGAYIRAAGKLNTPEAVDFVIANLHEIGAAKVLAATKSPKALPALRKHLKQLGEGASSYSAAEARVVIATLAEKDPADALMRMAEDREGSERLRLLALRALHDYNPRPLEGRVFKLYVSESDSQHLVKAECAALLKDSPSEEVTVAMMNHFLRSKPRTKTGAVALLKLRGILNQRLGTSYASDAQLREYVRKTLRQSRDR